MLRRDAMQRARLLLICSFCAAVLPILAVAMLAQAALGSSSRALSMALAIDACGNSLFGGVPTQTISSRTGNALLAGRPWARIAAPVIDFIFGAGHCLANATEMQ